MTGKDEGPVQFENVSEEARLEAFRAFLARTKAKLDQGDNRPPGPQSSCENGRGRFPRRLKRACNSG